MSAERILQLVDELQGSASAEQISQKYRELYEIARSNLEAFRRQRDTLAAGRASPNSER